MMLTALGLLVLGLVRRRCGRAALASAVLLGVTIGYPEQIRAAPLYVAKFEAVLDSGFGGLPPTLLQVTYVFEDEPPVFSAPHEAYYGFRSITVRLNGVEFPALPLEIGVQDNLPYSPIPAVMLTSWSVRLRAPMKLTSSCWALGSSS